MRTKIKVSSQKFPFKTRNFKCQVHQSLCHLKTHLLTLVPLYLDDIYTEFYLT